MGSCDLMPYILFVKIALQFGIIVALLACPPSGVQGQQQSQCSSYARCNELGTVALKHRRFDDAIELFTQQAALAELADIDAQTKSRGRSEEHTSELQSRVDI